MAITLQGKIKGLLDLSIYIQRTGTFKQLAQAWTNSKLKKDISLEPTNELSYFCWLRHLLA